MNILKRIYQINLFLAICLLLSIRLHAAEFTVSNTNDSGTGSLRYAISQANTSNGPHLIRFNIPITDPSYNPQTGVWTIAPTYPFSYIMKSGVVIDGNTQTLYAGNTNVEGPEIMLYGNGTVDYAFSAMNVSNTEIKGFVISGFIYGIQITGNAAANNRITGNYIGVNHNATDTLPNYIGVEIMGGAHDNIIGGMSAGERNIISGNSHIGIRLLQSSYNLVKNNYVGVDRTGTIALPNYDGISLEGFTQHNIIGGYTVAERNIVSGNVAYGIPLIGMHTNYNEIIGNYIGTNADGTSAIPNTYGVLFDDGSRYNIVGGHQSGAGNLISGNSGYGVFIYNLGTTENDVIGNLIGTDKTGTYAVPNGNGIVADGAAKNHFIDSNIISGNLQQGIAIHVYGTDSHKMTRNKIGTDINGINPLPNGEDGIRIAEGCRWNIIGIAPDSGNIIAYNGANGINIMTDADLYNSISGNSIHSNMGLGIDLYFPGPNANDPGDTDTGPNMRMNYPVITSAVYNNLTGITSITGYLDTHNPQHAKVELFLSAPYSNGYGQGEIYLKTLSTDAHGDFTTTFNQTPVLSKLCATATDADGNTSEFSLNFDLPPPAYLFENNVKQCLHVFPNPTNNYLNIEFANVPFSLPAKAHIYNVEMKLLSEFIITDSTYKLNVKNLKDGLYYILIKNKSENFFGSFLKIR